MSAWPFGDLLPLSYDVILADPPWDFSTYSDAGHGKSQHAHYGVMSFDDIAALPVSKLGRGDCLVWMWCCWPSIDKAIDVLKGWGFRYVTGGAWHKRTKNGKSGFGTGYRLRSATEPYLIGTLGNPTTVRNIRNVIETEDLDVLDAKLREHSRKPDEQYAHCERIMPSALRHVELFARQTRPGWDSWGNQVGKFDDDRSGGPIQSRTDQEKGEAA